MYYSRSPAPLLRFFPGLFCFHYSFDSSSPLFLFFLVSLLNFVLIVIFHHIPFTTLFLFLPHFVRFVITCTTFLPFPCFLFIIPLTNATPLFSKRCLYHVYPLPYTSWCHSSFILSPIFSPFYLLPRLSFICQFFLGADLPNGNENRHKDSKVTGEVCTLPFLPSPYLWKDNHWTLSLPERLSAGTYNLGQKVFRILHILTYRMPIPWIWYHCGPSPCPILVKVVESESEMIQPDFNIAFLGGRGEYLQLSVLSRALS